MENETEELGMVSRLESLRMTAVSMALQNLAGNRSSVEQLLHDAAAVMRFFQCGEIRTGLDSASRPPSASPSKAVPDYQNQSWSGR